MDFVRALISSFLRALGCGILLYAAVSFFSPNASAQACTSDPNVLTDSGCPDQGIAALIAERARDKRIAETAGTGNPYVAYQACAMYGSNGWACKATSELTGDTPQWVRLFETGKTCLQRNLDFMTDNPVLTWAGEAPTCVSGCAIQYNDLKRNKIGDMVVASSATGRNYTGSTCSERLPAKGSEEAEPRKNDACSAAGDGQTFCITPKGDHCHTTSNGKRFCWSPTETGIKSDGVDAQRRSMDGNAAIPSTPPTQGDWQQRNQHTASITDSTTGVTTTITVTNYISGGSKPDKPVTNPDISEPGEDGGEGGTATPGVDCQTPPTCSGGDAIGCAMLRQSHALACGTGEPVGEPVEAISDGDVTAPVGTLWGSTSDPGFGDVNLAGWAGVGTCPIRLSFNAFGKSFTMEGTQLCELLDALRALINIAGGRR
jgi:hypothetical protein